MIIDRLENAPSYQFLTPGVARALAALKGEIIHRSDGRHDIDGDRLFCLVQHYVTKPAEQCRLEAHRRYIDVQFMCSGEEVIRHAPISTLQPSCDYDSEKDVIFFHPAEAISDLRLREGMFAIFFPQDAHQPCMRAGEPASVHKVVLKVRVED